ncbi:MAG: Lanthionine biosynthesis protein LanB [Myxococcales bacterium]|nr:Lanthionine biosynthesis protein LanB [Myxococcales bacterium]
MTSESHLRAEFFVLRTPLLPFDELVRWGEGLEAASSGNDPDSFERSLARDRNLLRTRLRAIFDRASVREALFIASRSLSEELKLWLADPDGERGHNVEGALTRYFSRMTGRATPFGLFSGCSAGVIGERSELRLEGAEKYRHHIAFDLHYLWDLASRMTDQLRDRLVFYPNSSLHDVLGTVRYVRCVVDGSARRYKDQSELDSKPMALAVAAAANGARRRDLIDGLVAGGQTSEQAAQLVDGLIDRQVLVSELFPTVTGREPAFEMAERIAALCDDSAESLALKQALASLAEIEAAAPGVDEQRYRAGARPLEVLPAPIDPARLLLVELVKPVQAATLDEAVLDEVRRGIAVLHRLGTPDNSLQRFRERFFERYERAEVPLAEALDPETGIGYAPPSPSNTVPSILAGLTFPSPGPGGAAAYPQLALVLGKLEAAWRDHRTEITLDPADVDALAPAAGSLPGSFIVMARLAGQLTDGRLGDDFRISIEAGGGPPGTKMLTRFCHASPDLQRWVDRHVREEQALEPEVTLVEIVHLPEDHADANIVSRPLLREYEIPYLGRSGAPHAKQLPISDLTIAVAGGRLILRSRSLGKEVLPRLTTAHLPDPDRDPPIYCFLAALQSQGVVGRLRWSWGPFAGAAFLPRVTVGKAILSRASWTLRGDELRALAVRSSSGAFAAVQHLRHELGLPRWVAFSKDFDELPIDLDNVLSVDTILHEARTAAVLKLNELFPAPEEQCVVGPEGRFVHELLIPFINKTATPRPRSAAGAGESAAIREYYPGSEWLYVSFHGGPLAIERVLRDVVGPTVTEATATAAIDRWFFLPYDEPSLQLRLRMHGDPERLLTQVLPAIHANAAPLLARDVLWRIELDTYRREVERFGGPEGIVLSERVFHADSEAALAMLRTLPEADDRARWSAALQSVDRLFCDFEPDLASRRTILGQLRGWLSGELRLGAEFQRQLGLRFRRDRLEVEQTLDAARVDTGPLALRSQRLAPIVDELRACDRAGRLRAPLFELVRSFIHLNALRLLRTAANAQEVVLYDFLDRVYEGRIARERRAAR